MAEIVLPEGMVWLALDYEVVLGVSSTVEGAQRLCDGESEGQAIVWKPAWDDQDGDSLDGFTHPGQAARFHVERWPVDVEWPTAI